MKKLLTATEYAKVKGVSISYICRLCRLPEDDPNYIKNVKINNRLYMIIDKKILKELGGEYFSGE